MKTSLLKISAVCAVSLLSLEARGAVITFTDTLPTTDTILSNSTVSASGNLQVRNIGSSATNNTRWVGSGFQAPTSSSLDKVTFFIYNDLVGAAALGASMTISIVALPTQTGVPGAPFAPLYTETATVPVTYGNENYITFDLATPFALTADSFYGVMISFDSNASNRGINLTTAPGSTAGTGDLGSLFYTGDLGATYTTGTNPVNFVLQTVPEPSTTLLVFAAGTLLLAGRRRSAWRALGA